MPLQVHVCNGLTRPAEAFTASSWQICPHSPGNAVGRYSFPRLYAVGCGSVCPRMWLDLIQIVDQNVQQRSLECSIDFWHWKVKGQSIVEVLKIVDFSTDLYGYILEKINLGLYAQLLSDADGKTYDHC